MKKLSLLIVLFCVSLMTVAQDVIVKRDGSTIQSKVMEINGTEIKYKKWSNQDGPLYSINRSEVASINYQNGEKEDFSNEVVIRSSELPVYTGEPLRCVFSSVSNYTLYLGENELTQEELRVLLGKEGYDNFMSGNQMIQTGTAFRLPYLITFVAGLSGLIYGYTKDKDGNYNYTARTIGYAGMGIAIPCLVLESVFSNNGRNRIIETIDEYNRNKTKTVSFFVSPSILQYSHFQSQSTTGLGLTFSLNF